MAIRASGSTCGQGSSNVCENFANFIFQPFQKIVSGKDGVVFE